MLCPLLWLRLFLAAHLSTACSVLGEPASRTLQVCSVRFSTGFLRVLGYRVSSSSLIPWNIAVSSSSLIPWTIAVSSSPKDLCVCCFFLLEILSLLFSCLIPYSTHLNSNLSSSKKPFLASPYRNATHQVFAIIGTFHLTAAFLSSFEILWCFQAG